MYGNPRLPRIPFNTQNSKISKTWFLAELDKFKPIWVKKKFSEPAQKCMEDLEDSRSSIHFWALVGVIGNVSECPRHPPHFSRKKCSPSVAGGYWNRSVGNLFYNSPSTKKCSTHGGWIMKQVPKQSVSEFPLQQTGGGILKQVPNHRCFSMPPPTKKKPYRKRIFYMCAFWLFERYFVLCTRLAIVTRRKLFGSSCFLNAIALAAHTQ